MMIMKLQKNNEDIIKLKIDIGRENWRPDEQVEYEIWNRLWMKFMRDHSVDRIEIQMGVLLWN